MDDREMKENPLNEKESLDLIARMIQNTQGRLERGAGAPMLIWGYATLVTTLLVWLTVKQTLNYHYNYLWFLIPVVGCVCMLLRKKQPKGVRTYIDQVVGYIWIVLGGTGFLLSMVSILSIAWSLPILFIIIIIMGMGSTLTGLVTDFKPMVIGGVFGLIISILHYLISGYDIKMLTFAFAFVIMYIIPGHILNYKAKKACLKS
jgi:FtsH-binding integral membrane protein